MHHGHHEAAGESMAVDQGDSGHGVGDQTQPKGVQGVAPEPWGDGAMREFETVGVELGDAGGCDEDAGRVEVGARGEDVHCQDEGLAEGLETCCQSRC